MLAVELRSESVRNVLPHIFKRPLLSASPSDSLLQIGTFFAIGPQIYVDGLVVIDGHRKPVGRIGCYKLIQHILQAKGRWLETKVGDIMESPAQAVEAASPLDAALDIFRKTRFAFVPVTVNEIAVASLSIRDVLKPVANANLPGSAVSKLCSPLVTVKAGLSIGAALETMFEKSIRNLAIRVGDAVHVINDRRLLEFLFSHDGREVLAKKDFDGLYSIPVDTIDAYRARKIDGEMSIGSAAGLMLDINTPFLLVGDSFILTPWDIVMKGLLGRE